MDAGAAVQEVRIDFARQRESREVAYSPAIRRTLINGGNYSSMEERPVHATMVLSDYLSVGYDRYDNMPFTWLIRTCLRDCGSDARTLRDR